MSTASPPYSRLMKAIALTSLAIYGVFAAGCTNPPNGLRMSIASAQDVCSPNKPIRLNVKLAASGGTVCLTRPAPHSFTLDLEQSEASKALHRITIAYCGTGDQWVLLVYPFLAVGCLLDVADVAGRFVVLRDGQEHTCAIDLIPTEDGFVALAPDDPDRDNWLSRSAPWPPGNYRLRASFRSEPSSAYPPPLFWRVYNTRVDAETSFVVSEPGRAVGFN
jgi:hypothetical protein